MTLVDLSLVRCSQAGALSQGPRIGGLACPSSERSRAFAPRLKPRPRMML